MENRLAGVDTQGKVKVKRSERYNTAVVVGRGMLKEDDRHLEHEVRIHLSAQSEPRFMEGSESDSNCKKPKPSCVDIWSNSTKLILKHRKEPEGRGIP